MAKRENERCREAAKWMRINYGKRCLAPLTGTDWRAFDALVHAWDLWTYTRSGDALRACEALLRCMQPSTRNLGVALVPFSADWGDELHVRLCAKGIVEGVSLHPFERLIAERRCGVTTAHGVSGDSVNMARTLAETIIERTHSETDCNTAEDAEALARLVLGIK